MADRKLTTLLATRDPFALMRQMTSELDRVFERSQFGSFRPELPEAGWSPKIDVVEKDGRLITRVDLPGMKKEEVLVEASDGRLVLSGERKREHEETKDNCYRSEREYGSFYRSVPLPEGVNLAEVKATFADGVLEVSVPLPSATQAKVTKVPVEEPAKAAKSAA